MYGKHEFRRAETIVNSVCSDGVSNVMFVLVPALQKIKKNNPRAKASVIGNRLIVNSKRYFHYDVPKELLATIQPTANGPRVNTQSQEDNDHEEAYCQVQTLTR